MDRMDLQVEVPQVPYDDLTRVADGESSDIIRMRVDAARGIQESRFAKMKIFSNAAMGPEEMGQFCPLNKKSATLLKQLMARFRFSARAYASILKVARTIADLAGQERIRDDHILEAVQYKALERDEAS